MPRVITFTDGSNLFSHLRNTFGSGLVNHPELGHMLAGPGRTLVEWRHYAAPVPQGTTQQEADRYAGQQKFFHFVRRHRKGVLRLGRFEPDRTTGRLREKGVDVLLAVDLVRMAAENRYDVAIVLSGDGDIVPAVETVQQVYAKQVEVAMPNVPAYHMRHVADAYIEITAGIFEQIKR